MEMPWGEAKGSAGVVDGIYLCGLNSSILGILTHFPDLAIFYSLSQSGYSFGEADRHG